MDHNVPPQRLQPHRAVMILVFGIIGLVVCFPFGIAAWIMGKNDLHEMAQGRMDSTGEGMTNAGKIVGMVATALAIIGIVISMLMMALAIVSGFNM